MTSLFEQAGTSVAKAVPIDLMAQGARGISVMEFVQFEAETLEGPIADETAKSNVSQESERTRQMRIMIDAARAEAEAMTRAQMAEEYAAQVAEQRTSVSRLCGVFAKSRELYFAQAEEQVVRLALQIASRVLCREVQADPLHLLATVRAALSRVSDGSGVIMRVPSLQVEAWSAILVTAGECRVEVTPDAVLGDTQCVLETTIGTVELGVETQLNEIGRGFLDLLRRGTERIA